MPEGVGYGPQFTASVGKKLNYIGDHCYAYSGLITDNDSGSPQITLLDFTTGDGYIDLRLSILSDEAATAALYTLIELNGVGVFRLDGDASGIGSFQFDNPFYMIIPPFTRFHLKVGSNSTGRGHNSLRLYLTK
jgi:hypothetical protein